MSRTIPPAIAQQLDKLDRRMAANRLKFAAVSAKPAFGEEAEAWKQMDIARLEVEMNDLMQEKARVLKPLMN